MPQENGLKTDCRHVLLKDGRKRIEILADEDFCFSALPNTWEDYWASYHTHEVPESKHVVLSLDHLHRGLGTRSCGPDTLDEYKITGKSFRWSYLLNSRS